MKPTLETNSREPQSIHTDIVQYSSDMRAHTDLSVEDATKRNGQIRLKIGSFRILPWYKQCPNAWI